VRLEEIQQAACQRQQRKRAHASGTSRQLPGVEIFERKTKKQR
jgi:hypothetical protein